MNCTPTSIEGAYLLEPKVYGDDRGFFYESFNTKTFRELTGLDVQFVQDNHSGSKKNVLRGLHYQIHQAQGKLIRVVAGEIWDVAVDLRPHSPTFGKWTGQYLSAENRRMFWLPAGLAHGFLAVGDWNEVLYRTTDFWAPQYERSILWNDEQIGIAWPLNGEEPIVSLKDMAGVRFRDAEVYGDNLATKRASQVS